MKNPKVQLVVGLLISAFFLYLTLRPVKFADLWLAIRTYNWLWSIPFLIVTFASMWVRAVRWRHLILPTASFRSARLFSPMMAGFAINGLLPARIGEFARAYILGSKGKVPVTAAFATIVVERIFDSLVLLVMLFVMFATLKFDPSIRNIYDTRHVILASQFRQYAGVTGGLLAIIVLLIAVLISTPGRRYYRQRLLRSQPEDKLPRWLRENQGIFPPISKLPVIGVWIVSAAAGLLLIIAATGWHVPQQYQAGKEYVISAENLRPLSISISQFLGVLIAGSLLLLWQKSRILVQRSINTIPFAPKSVRAKISLIIDSFTDGLASLKNIRTSLLIMLESVIVWILIAWSMQVAAYGFTSIRITLLQAVALTVISCISIIIPAAPGYWGLLEIGLVFGLKVLGIEQDNSRALAYALITHSLQYFPITAVGLYCLWKERVSISEISSGRKKI
jgi:uncharacterized membrane protein YbhN (UPF0104 family)